MSSAKLSVAKRKREDTQGDPPTTSVFGSTTSLLLATPKLRAAPSGLFTPSASVVPSTPLLSLPSPSNELLPLLNARAARAAESTPSHALLRSQSNVTPSTAPTSTAAQQLAAQQRSMEAAATERERIHRLTVEELRATVRAKTSDLTEAQLKAEQRERQFEQVKQEYEQRIEKLQTQMRFIHGEEQKESLQLKERDEEVRQLQDQQRESRLELGKMKHQLVYASSPIRTPARSCGVIPDDGQVKHLESLVSLQARNISELESEIGSLNTRIEEADQDRLRIAELEARLAHTQARLQDAESRLITSAAEVEAAEVTSKRAGEFLAAQAKSEVLLAENERLREQRHNAALAAEQLLGAQSKLHRLEAERESSARIALENEQLKARLHEWESSVLQLGINIYEEDGPHADAAGEDVDMTDASSAAGSASDDADVPPSKRRKRHLTPRPFIQSYHTLQSTNLTLQAKYNQVELQAKMLAKEKQSLQERSHTLAQESTQQQQSLSQLKSELLTLQRKVVLLEKEKDGLQKVLDAYDNEQAPLGPPKDSTAAPTPMQIDSDQPELDQQHRALKTRVQYLETVVKELEQQLSKYQHESGVQPPRNPSSPEEPIPSVISLLAQITNLEKQLAHLESITSDLTEKVDWINQQYPHLLDKEYGNFKIVQLSHNPSHIKIQSKYKLELDQMTKQNQILQLRVNELQGGGTAPLSTGGDISAVSCAPSASSLVALESSFQTRITALESEKSQLEKKAQRLKEIFGQKVQEFRSICYLLTGYKIEVIHGNSYRLKNMYAAKEADHLMFQQQPNKTAADGSSVPGGLSVLETDFTKGLDGSITTYLEKFESIPGFLAAVTLHLLEAQTKVR